LFLSNQHGNGNGFESRCHCAVASR
jgi:hypothetical protein